MPAEVYKGHRISYGFAKLDQDPLYCVTLFNTETSQYTQKYFNSMDAAKEFINEKRFTNRLNNLIDNEETKS